MVVHSCLMTILAAGNISVYNRNCNNVFSY